LLGLPRVFVSIASAVILACAVLPLHEACRVLMTTMTATYLAGVYGKSVLGGVMGDFLGATICIAEVPADSYL
jgi:cobalamin synthase